MRAGGGRGYSAPRNRSSAPPPAPRKPQAPAAAPAPAPAVSGTTGGGAVASLADGWFFGGGYAMVNRAVDAVFGPRKVEVAHTTAAAAATAAASLTTMYDVHTRALVQCVRENRSDISRCQYYADMLNGCLREGQVAVVEASG